MKRLRLMGSLARWSAFLAAASGSVALAQFSITTTTAYTQNLDIGTAAAATLPEGWKGGASSTDWASMGTATVATFGTQTTTYSVAVNAAGNNLINWANGLTASATDRAVGVVLDKSVLGPQSVGFAFANNTGSTITSLTVAWNYEQYYSGNIQGDWTFFHGNTSAAATAATAGNLTYTAVANVGAQAQVAATATARSVTLTGLNIPSGTGNTYYFRWTYTALTAPSGNSTAGGSGIDDFSMTPTVMAIGVSPTTLSGFSSSFGTASTSQSFTVSAQGGLNSNVLVTAPTGYEVSSDNVTFSPSITITAASLASPQTAFVRLASTAAVGTANGNITLSATGAANATVALTGSVSVSLPTVTSPTATSITATGATLGGDVTSDGGATVTARGVVYSLSSQAGDPAIDGTGVTQLPGTGTTGAFTVSATGLTAGTGYKFRAYAVNSAGTSYSAVSSFTTKNNDANLSFLGEGPSNHLISSTLSPSPFVSSTTSYSIDATKIATHVHLTPSLSDANATMEVRINSGSWAALANNTQSDDLILAEGLNTVNVRVTAEDGVTQKTYSLSIDRFNNVKQWRFDKFGTKQNDGNAANDNIVAGDGLSNITKYAYGLEPATPVATALTVNTSTATLTARGKPTVAAQKLSTGVKYTARYVRKKTHATDGLVISVRFSADLVTWVTSTATPVVVGSDADYDCVEVPYPLSIGGKKTGYFQVNVGTNE